MKESFLNKDKTINWKQVGFAFLMLTGFVLVIIILRKIFKMFGDPQISNEAEEKRKQLKFIAVDSVWQSSIGVEQAKQRAEEIHRGFLEGDKYLIMEQFIKQEYWPLLRANKPQDLPAVVDIAMGPVQQLAGLMASGSKITPLDKYMAFESEVALTKSDYELIAKKYSVRLSDGINWFGVSALSTKDWGSLKDQFQEFGDRELQDLHNYIYSKTEINI
jgi:hypothetical protein